MYLLRVLLFTLLMAFSSYSFAAPLTTHLAVQEISEEGLALTLNDGSQWDITYFGGLWKFLGLGWFEQKNVSNWVNNDEIEIRLTLNSSLLADFLYIKNLSKKELVIAHALPKHPPSVDSSACLWVMDLDEATNQVTLNNGTIWHKPVVDAYTFAVDIPVPFAASTPPKKWEIGDVITFISLEDHSFLCTACLWNHSTNEMIIFHKTKSTS